METSEGRRAHRVSAGSINLTIDAPGEGPWAQVVGRFVACLGPAGREPACGTITCGATVTLPDSPPDVVDQVSGVSLWTNAGQPIVDSPSGRASFPSSTTVIIDNDPEYSPSHVGQLMIPHALAWILASHDEWLLHAAAVIPPASTPGGNTAILITGPTGTGKSTSAVAALNAGWLVLADDMVTVRPNTGGFEVRGILLPLSAPGELTGVAAHAPPLANDPRGRRVIGQPGSVPLDPRWWAIGAVAVVGHGDQASGAATPMSGSQAVQSLWPAMFGAMGGARLRRWFPRAAGLSRLPSFRLNLGTDSDTRMTSTVDALAVIATIVEAQFTNDQLSRR